MNRPYPQVSLLAVALVAAAAVPADASAWQVRALAARVEPGDGFEARDGADFLRSEPEESWALGAAAEYRFSHRLGLGLTAHWSDVDVATEAGIASLGGADGDRGDLGMEVYTVGLDLHLTPGRSFELVLTPGVAYVGYDDLTLDLSGLGIVEEVAFDDEVTASFGLRLDYPRGPWLLTGGITWVDTSAEAVDAEVDGEKYVLEIDPLVIGFGVGYRF